MNEHQLYDTLRDDVKLCKSVRLKKLSGTAMSAGLPDLLVQTKHGNFLVELKAIEPPKRRDTIVYPWRLCSALQQRELRDTWNLNGQAALAVGFQFGPEKYLQFFTPTGEDIEWLPYGNLLGCVRRVRGQGWDFLGIETALLQSALSFLKGKLQA